MVHSSHFRPSLIGALFLFACSHLSADEAMFPPAPEAKAFMDIDGKGFIVNGQRTFLASGSIHYPRVPRDLWHDRLLRLRRAGFNTVQTYTFWNYHEPVENQFEFTGEKDFEAYLKTAQDLDLYATVRVGPYVCAEWDSGGYPVWAKFKPDVVVRKESPGYMALQDHWLGEILPKVAAHQINKGGNVILVQLENEGQWWGAWKGPASNPYWEDLHQQAIKGGLEVPYFMSGFHHGSTPVPENPDNTGRQCPWYSTEIWAGWYSNYGPSDYEYMRTERCNEKILARGGNGYNYYMFHGGTNFDSWNDNENAATYDYGAALGEAGDPRPIYYREKANNLFATSFADILENSSVATAEYQDFATHARVIGARKSPAGTIVFVQGHVANDDPAVIQSIGAGTGGSLHLFPLEVTPIVLNAPIIPAPANIKIVQATSAILGLAHNGETTTLILYGQPGDTGVLTLALGEQIKKFNVAYPTTMPVEIVERLGGQSLRILAMSRQLADRTWIVGHPKREYVVVGPEFVGDFSMESGKAAMTIERPYLHPAPNKVVVFGGVNEAPQHLEVKADPSTDAAPAPALSEWQESIPPESNPDFNDASWKASDDPLQMGADDDISAFAWYRATVQAPQAGSGTLHFPGAADHLIVFINGRRCAATPSVVEPKPTSLELKDGKLSWTVQTDFQAGRNAIAVLATHQGRDKAGGYYGPIDHYFSKGIFEPVDLEMAGQNIPVKGWKMHGGLPAPSTLGFGPVTASETPAFFASTFNAPRPGIGPNPILRVKTTGLSRGTIFLNGHCIGRYPATVKVKDEPVPMYLPECWFAADAKNHLAVFDEEGKSPAQVQLVVETEASREVIAVSKPTDAATPIDLPPYHPVRLGDFITPAMEKPISASSSAPDHEPENANDADGETYWTPATEPTPDHPEWLMIDLQKTCHLLSCEIFWRNPVSLYPHLIEGSQDGKTWITLDDRRQNDTRQEDRTDAPFTHPADVRYLRLTVTKVVDPKKPLRILEVRAWEVPHN